MSTSREKNVEAGRWCGGIEMSPVLQRALGSSTESRERPQMIVESFRVLSRISSAFLDQWSVLTWKEL